MAFAGGGGGRDPITDPEQDAPPTLEARPGTMLLHRASGVRGALVKFTGDIAVLRDKRGGEHTFHARPGGFAHLGETVTLVRPTSQVPAEGGLKRSSAGGLVADGPARVARASRLWVEGDHDARLLERVWGDELRELAVVVEPLGGVDDLPARVREFRPGPERRLAVLVDHLVPGSKERRLADAVTAGHPRWVRVVGHPWVDVWQCVRPRSLGIDAWPEVPRGEEWKAGVCDRLGWGSVTDGWRRVLAAVSSFADLEPELVGAVESALDVLHTAPERCTVSTEL